MRLSRRIVTSGSAVAALLGAAVVLAPAAGAAVPAAATAGSGATTVVSAASAAAAYNGVCGAGYSVVNSAQIGTVGTVYLTYNHSTGNNCVVTIRSTPGRAVPMTASIGAGTSTDISEDSGNYTTYAGPAYLHAPGECVNWRGAIAGQVAGKDHTNCARLA